VQPEQAALEPAPREQAHPDREQKPKATQRQRAPVPKFPPVPRAKPQSNDDELHPDLPDRVDDAKVASVFRPVARSEVRPRRALPPTRQRSSPA